ncbi:MAG TPA: hypothetical protein VFF70_07065, partial [Anaerolineae bacterium]|nr:hypothetical protein [Anaerolineae bacterium]
LFLRHVNKAQTTFNPQQNYCVDYIGQIDNRAQFRQAIRVARGIEFAACVTDRVQIILAVMAFD